MSRRWTALLLGGVAALGLFAVLAAMLGLRDPGSVSSNRSAKITYIANEGFLVEAGSRKVLIDALFDDDTIDDSHVPGGETLAQMVNGDEPFENVDLILVTHSHRDHFAPELVLRHLAANPDTVLAAPSQAIEKLRATGANLEKLGGRVKELGLGLFESVELAVEGIRVRAHRLRHSEYLVTDEKTGQQYNRHEHVENLAYVIEMGDARLLHVGDAVLPLNREYLESERFPEEKMNIVFLEFFDWSSETRSILERRFEPDHVVFMHLPPQEEVIESLAGRLTERFPEAVIFRKPLESRSFSRPGTP